MSGVKQESEYGGFACFVVKIGNKDKVARFNHKILGEVEQTVAESILLDKNPEDINDSLVKIKPYRCMTPKGVDKHWRK